MTSRQQGRENKHWLYRAVIMNASIKEVMHEGNQNQERCDKDWMCVNLKPNPIVHWPTLCFLREYFSFSSLDWDVNWSRVRRQLRELGAGPSWRLWQCSSLSECQLGAWSHIGVTGPGHGQFIYTMKIIVFTFNEEHGNWLWAWAWQLWVTIYFWVSSVILHASLCDKTNNDDSETCPRILRATKEN